METESKSIWCVVANVTRDPHPEGHDGALRLGTRHFAPGAKLYCFPIRWGDGGDRLRVLGKHRGAPKLVQMVIPSKLLTDWRVKQILDPRIVREMEGAWA